MFTHLILAVGGTVITLAGGLVLAYPLFRSEARRREGFITGWVNGKGRNLGLKGHYSFGFQQWSPRGSIGSGSYRPLNEEDRLLYDQIGGKLTGEAIERSNRLFWTDKKLGVAGVLLLFVGAALILTSLLAG